MNLLEELLAAEAAAATPAPEPQAPAPAGTWPHGDAWNGAEISTFQRRLDLFRQHGMEFDDAEDLAERLVQRDRDHDERSLCLECAHYRGGRCATWRAAGFVRPAALGDYATTLKRCPSYTPKD